jgi:outer membrane protein insertion porin family
MVGIVYQIDLGDKSKIAKISFIGDKIFKDGKLRSIIVSEEYKFWKFISGKKYLNENLINFDNRLLKNFYLNKGYYNSTINSSFAKLINEDEFELIYNIDAGEKVFFGDLKVELPVDYNKENFTKLYKILDKTKGEPYSINLLDKILESIEINSLNEQYESVDIDVIENLEKNKLNLNFIIKEPEQKFFVERFNILGNNVTHESVIRNQFELDEGDPFNEILKNKSINNIQNLNFFKSVKSEVKDGSSNETKSTSL